MSLSIWIDLLTNTSFTNGIYMILLKTMICYWACVRFPQLPVISNLCWLGVISSNFLLFLILGLRWLISGYFPLSNLYESLLFLDWCLLFILIVAETKTRTKLLGAVVLPIALLIISFASLILPTQMQEAAPLVPALQSNWLMMHVSMMMLSYATLIVGSLLSILFLIISNGKEINYNLINSRDSFETPILNNITVAYDESTTLIKTQKDSQLKLLSSIDNWSYRVIGLGFPFLTIGIIAGGVWANEAWGSYWSWDPKETWALITWLVFAAYLHARITKNWEGKRTAVLGSLGFFVIWVCYLGVNFLGKGLHSYGWLS